jgi:hypothetical protein
MTVRKSDPTSDEAVEIAPGIFANGHAAEQQLWQGQSSHTQKLAKSPVVKKKYQSEVKTLKKDMKVACSELRDLKD